jgi:predicted nucleic acid-binding protein
LTTRYLLDTSVVSSIRPDRTGVSDTFRNWVLVAHPRLHLSAVSVFEIEQGVEKLIRAEAFERAAAIRNWLRSLIDDFGERLLPLDTRVAREAGKLSDAAIAIGRHPGVADIFLAATASAHGLTLLTHNVRHFTPLGIAILDPAENLLR